MHFLLSRISVVYVLTTPIPEDGGDDATVKQIRKRAKWDNDDYVCRGLILNVMEQHNELLGILGRFTQHKMNMDEAIRVPCIIDKLPPSWKDFKHTLKHKKEELSLVELGSHLRIEESLRAQDSDKPKGNNVVGPQNNLISSGIECIFVGYAEHFKAFRFYVIEPNDSVSINSIIESREAIFDENRFPSVPRPSLKIPNGTKDIGGSGSLKRSLKRLFNNLNLSLEKAKGIGLQKDFGLEFQLYLIEGTRDEDVAIWKEAINDEMDSIMGNNTWVLADLPSGCKPLGCKWIFKRKLKVDGTIEKFKARMVIHGFKQRSGIYYFDTYAPVARISTIRLLIAMTSIHNLIIHQMDVKTAFLNGDLDEEVYMNQPQGFIMPGNKNKVCKLIKSLSRLKQAPKQWHQKFDEVVLSNGYLHNQADKCVYRKFNETGKGVIICLYVDDMLIFGTDQVQVDLTKEFLSSRFSMKDMEEADVILGIKIKHESNGIAISRSHYIKKVLKKFNYFDCTLVSTPTDTSEKLMPNNGQAVSQLEYSRVIGCLMYAMTCTRPDIAFAVGKLSRYTSNPGTQHWQAVQRVLKYLKKTMNYRLTYTGYPLVLEGYTDASWFSNTKDNSSTSGWVFLGMVQFLGLSRSKLALLIPLWFKPIAPISIRCDSAATLVKAYSQMYNGKSKHLDVRHSMIRELITNGVISIEFVRILKDGGKRRSVKVKEPQERCIIKAFQVNISRKNIKKTCEKVFGNWDYVTNGEDNNKGCRIMVGWNTNMVQVWLISQSRQSMFLLVETIGLKTRFFCTMIYASNSGMGRMKLWKDLETQKIVTNSTLGATSGVRPPNMVVQTQ
ncbi:zinc finger, CCHC-type containing protein [Tanacetum coccineum]